MGQEIWTFLASNSESTNPFFIPDDARIRLEEYKSLYLTNQSWTIDYYLNKSDSQSLGDASSAEYLYCHYACKIENQSELTYRALGIGFIALFGIGLALFIHP
jgi:hypothetical protein